MVEFTCQYCGHEHSSKGCVACENGEPYRYTRCLGAPVLKQEVDALFRRKIKTKATAV